MYLAAAVSDFYIPHSDTPTHKIQVNKNIIESFLLHVEQIDTWFLEECSEFPTSSHFLKHVLFLLSP